MGFAIIESNLESPHSAENSRAVEAKRREWIFDRAFVPTLLRTNLFNLGPTLDIEYEVEWLARTRWLCQHRNKRKAPQHCYSAHIVRPKCHS